MCVHEIIAHARIARQNALDPDCCVRATTAAASPRFACIESRARRRLLRGASYAAPPSHLYLAVRCRPFG